MRLRNVKNKEIILNNSDMVIKYDESYLGNWYSIFKNNNPIEIEIGMGKGQFVINKAKLNPDVNYIGIEKYDSVLARAVEKVDENIPNLKFVRMDAMDINRFFYKEISKIYLNFSDPWPKKRHARRRLTSHDFLSKYDDITEIYLMSDILITDYSSVFFDFANLKRPMLFYTYDLDKYRDVLRGFYINMEEELPGPLVFTTDEVIDTIKHMDEITEKYADRYVKFYDKFCGWEDGHSSQRVVETVFEKN